MVKQETCATKGDPGKAGIMSRCGTIVLLSVVIWQLVGYGRAWGQVDLQVSSQRDLIPQHLLGVGSCTGGAP